MSIDLPGFADPVREAQSTFRAVLDALSRPGTLHSAGAGLNPPAPLMRASAAILLALVDGDTPLWTTASFATAHDWIAFHCGAAFAALPAQAAVVLADAWPDDFAGLRTGSDEAPEDGATLVLQVTALGTGRPLRLEGPGLLAPTSFAVEGLPDGFVADWSPNHALSPRGVDLVLCAGDTLAALPRSTLVSEG